MAVLESRQVVVWSIPTIAALVLSLVWLRRRRQRDPGGSRSHPPQPPVQEVISSTPTPLVISSPILISLSPISLDGLGPSPYPAVGDETVDISKEEAAPLEKEEEPPLPGQRDPEESPSERPYDGNLTVEILFSRADSSSSSQNRDSGVGTLSADAPEGEENSEIDTVVERTPKQENPEAEEPMRESLSEVTSTVNDYSSPVEDTTVDIQQKEEDESEQPNKTTVEALLLREELIVEEPIIAEAFEEPIASKVVKEPLSKDVEEPILENIDEPIVSKDVEGPTLEDIEEPIISKIVEVPTLEDIEEPIISKIVEVPILEDIEEPVISKIVEVPILEDIKEPIVPKIVEEPIVEDIEEPILEDIEEPIVSKIVEEPLLKGVEELIELKTIEEPLLKSVEEPVELKTIEEPILKGVEEPIVLKTIEEAIVPKAILEENEEIVDLETTVVVNKTALEELQPNIEVEVKLPLEEQSVEMEKGVLEEKLASLELDTMKINQEGGKENAERDSANQSPSEVMLASPSISNFSDAHSEGSSDSGKGHSDVATSPSRTPAGGSSLAGDSAFSVYEFILPQVMVGRLIGRHGSFIHEIRTQTHTNIFIKRHPDTSKLKICAIEGTQQDIDKAIEKIRQKFPLRRFPKLTLEKVTFVSVNNPPPLKPEDFHLQLVEGVNNDVILSSLISAAHFFLQQPSHPTYSALCRLNQVMNVVYSNSEAPMLDTPIKDAICAAPTMGGWYRAQIVSVDEENMKCDVRFLDYGGYLTLESSLLRQIRGDLLMLPFQAVECYLANVMPVGDDGWSEEARLVVQSLTHGQLLQAQIYDYAEDGTPQVYLYSTVGTQIVLINEELVARGYATVVTPPAEE